MDLKCLIKLLLEKEIIVENVGLQVQRKNGEMAIAYYKYEYEEVLNKIKEATYDDNTIRVTTTRTHLLDDKYCCVINMPNLVNYLLDESDKEEFEFYTSRFFIDEHTLHGIMSNFQNDIKLERTEVGNANTKIINMRLKNNRLKKEQEKKDKVLNFINQLP